MSSIVFEIFDTRISVMIKEIDLELRQTEIIGQTLEEFIRLSFKHIASFKYEFFN